MKEILIGLIDYAFENKNFDITDYIYEILLSLATTINAPSNWRSLGEELVELYSDNQWVMENCKLYEFTEE